MDNEMAVPSVSDSILNSVKKSLGIFPEQTDFNIDILICINAAISTLSQIGVGPPNGFVVEDDSTTYGDYLGLNSDEVSMVKQYLVMKTKLSFDPPQSSIVAEALKTSIAEYEWRLNAQVDPCDTFE